LQWSPPIYSHVTEFLRSSLGTQLAARQCRLESVYLGASWLGLTTSTLIQEAQPITNYQFFWIRQRQREIDKMGYSYSYSYGVGGIGSTLAIVGACELELHDAVASSMAECLLLLTMHLAQICSSPAVVKPSTYDRIRTNPSIPRDTAILTRRIFRSVPSSSLSRRTRGQTWALRSASDCRWLGQHGMRLKTLFLSGFRNNLRLFTGASSSPARPFLAEASGRRGSAPRT
jgi:hypothetical protein